MMIKIHLLITFIRICFVSTVVFRLLSRFIRKRIFFYDVLDFSTQITVLYIFTPKGYLRNILILQSLPKIKILMSFIYSFSFIKFISKLVIASFLMFKRSISLIVSDKASFKYYTYPLKSRIYFYQFRDLIYSFSLFSF